MSISDTLEWLRGRATFARGIHPPGHKSLSAERPIACLPPPETVTIPLHQHAGAPARCVVKPREEVRLGQLIGAAAESGISANVHASLPGKVQPLTAVTLPNGRRSAAIAIKVDAEAVGAGEQRLQQLFGGDWHPDDRQRFFAADIVAAVREAGIVGLGGAAFPTHVKLAAHPTKPVDTVLLNGCECEPYLTSDYRLMLEVPQAIVTGLLLAMKATGAERGVIAVEDNKPAALQALSRARDQLAGPQAGGERLDGEHGPGESRVSIVACQTKYPMGGERQLIPAVFGLEVPTGGFPLDVGIVVINVGTAAEIAAAVLRGHSLTHRVVSVSGRGIDRPGNLLVPIGTPLRHVLDSCGGLNPQARRVIAGGPMMGFTITDLDVPITKGTSGLTVLSEEEIQEARQTACIRCGRCLDVCPLGLAPTRIAHAARQGDLDLARQYDLMACCECGCCAYVCPAHIPLAQYIRMGKTAHFRQLASNR